MIRNSIRSCLIAATFAVAAFVGRSALAADTAPEKPITQTLTVQQQRMRDCNQQAQGKTGETRSAFMKECLKGKPGEVTPETPATPQQRMSACNADAKAQQLSGAARKKFLSECLKRK